MSVRLCHPTQLATAQAWQVPMLCKGVGQRVPARALGMSKTFAVYTNENISRSEQWLTIETVTKTHNHDNNKMATIDRTDGAKDTNKKKANDDHDNDARNIHPPIRFTWQASGLK